MRLSSKTGLAYALAALTFGGGLAAALTTGNPSWLSRSGSVIVVIGILLTSTQILENNRRLRQRRAHWEAQVHRQIHSVAARAPSLRDWAGRSDLDALGRSRNDEENKWVNERSGLYMLVIGTLVWGFGDLLAPLIS